MNKYFEFLEKTGKMPKEQPQGEEPFDLGLEFESLEDESHPEEPEAPPLPDTHDQDFSNALKMRALRARRGLK